MLYHELTYLGQIGQTVNGKRLYATGDRKPVVRDRLKARLYSMTVNGIFERRKVTLNTRFRVRYVPFYLDPTNVRIDPLAGRIAGTTRQNGAVAPYKPVFLFHRPNMIRVRGAMSDANGAFSFPCVALSSTYLIFSLDSLTGAPDFNAAIADAVTPEPMS